jgi:hypothetical protein
MPMTKRETNNEPKSPNSQLFLKISWGRQSNPRRPSPLMPQLYQAADTIGTIHYSRFTALSEKTLLFLVDFDGEFGH